MRVSRFSIFIIPNLDIFNKNKDKDNDKDNRYDNMSLSYFVDQE